MNRQNCWELKNCGRHSEGHAIDEFGICPAAKSSKHDGTNKGTHAGRFCWTVPGTLCEGKPHTGTPASKLLMCLYCDVFKQINDEEGRNFILHAKNTGDQTSQDENRSYL
ncbi:MAG: hypothetical protein KAR11_04440 [Phycisphaerae bacterium]|nr:hypothetical protein [Phycisphaerae bacterium]